MIQFIKPTGLVAGPHTMRTSFLCRLQWQMYLYTHGSDFCGSLCQGVPHVHQMYIRISLFARSIIDVFSSVSSIVSWVFKVSVSFYRHSRGSGNNIALLIAKETYKGGFSNEAEAPGHKKTGKQCDLCIHGHSVLQILCPYDIWSCVRTSRRL